MHSTLQGKGFQSGTNAVAGSPIFPKVPFEMHNYVYPWHEFLFHQNYNVKVFMYNVYNVQENI